MCIFTSEEKPFNKDYFKLYGAGISSIYASRRSTDSVFIQAHRCNRNFQENKQSIYTTIRYGACESCCYVRLSTWLRDTVLDLKICLGCDYHRS